jgi:hypothetical protein
VWRDAVLGEGGGEPDQWELVLIVRRAGQVGQRSA